MEDKDYDFKKGKLHHKSETVSWDMLKHEIGAFADWNDGYLAFSNMEMRLKNLKDLGVDSLSGRVNEIIQGAQGYLMEADLWRANDDGWEEIYIEREDGRFLVERWRLEKKGVQEDGTDTQGYPCLWREAAPLIYKPSLDKGFFTKDELGAIEIVVPDIRLHIFMSVKKG